MITLCQFATRLSLTSLMHACVAVLDKLGPVATLQQGAGAAGASACLGRWRMELLECWACFPGHAASAEEWCRILRMYRRAVGVLLSVALASKERRRLGWLAMMSAVA